MNRHTQQSSAARQRPTAATPVAMVEMMIPLTQYLRKVLKMRGVMMTQPMLKLLKRRTIQGRLTEQYSWAWSKMAMKVPTIMSMVTETEVTARINPHSRIISQVYQSNLKSMDSQGGFFQQEITDQFVSSLDDLTYAELVTILRDNFLHEYYSLDKINQSNAHLRAELTNGQVNLTNLSSIREQHEKQKLKLRSELELIEAECEQLKAELRQVIQ